jgi:hypothetical protein
MNRKLRFALYVFAAISGIIMGGLMMWVAIAEGGDTHRAYRAPTYGVYSPAVSATSNTRVIGSRTNPGFDVSAPKPSGPARNVDEVLAQIEHMSKEPRKPDRGPVYREFNILTDQHEKYQQDLFEWRARGRELREKYNDPSGTNFWR